MPAKHKLSSEQTDSLLQDLRNGVPYRVISDRYSVSKALISKLALKHNLRRHSLRSDAAVPSTLVSTLAAFLQHAEERSHPAPKLVEELRQLVRKYEPKKEQP